VAAELLKRQAACWRVAANATFQRPGQAGNHVGFYPFPTNIANDRP
jgi:hypothetical protein